MCKFYNKFSLLKKMDNYTVKIINQDEEYFEQFEIIFTNDEGNKLAHFDFNLTDIIKGVESENFNELKDIDKAIILKDFSQNVGTYKDSEINFIMINGNICIKISDGLMKFKIEFMFSGSEFVVKINEQLIQEFQQNIFHPLVEKYKLD